MQIGMVEAWTSGDKFSKSKGIVTYCIKNLCRFLFHLLLAEINSQPVFGKGLPNSLSFRGYELGRVSALLSGSLSQENPKSKWPA
jgi:hypothetical protein